MSKIVMGGRRHTDVLLASGLQSSDIHTKNPTERLRMWDALWRAVRDACDPNFKVDP